MPRWWERNHPPPLPDGTRAIAYRRLWCRVCERQILPGERIVWHPPVWSHTIHDDLPVMDEGDRR